MARLEIPSIVVHNGPPSVPVPGTSGMERTARQNKQKADMEDPDPGCVHHSHNSKESNTCSNKSVDNTKQNSAMNINNNNNNNSNNNNNNNNRSSDGSKQGGSLSRSRSNAKTKMLTRSHAMREATSPPPDPNAQHNNPTTSVMTSSTSTPIASTASVTSANTVTSPTSGVQTTPKQPLSAVSISSSSTVATTTTVSTSTAGSTLSTQSLNVISAINAHSTNNNSNHSNSSNNSYNNNSHHVNVSGSRSNSRPKLRRQSSSQSQSSFDSWTPFLSRENSTEQYTDATGTDLETFLQETVNQSPKTRSLMFKVEQELFKLASDRTMVYYRFPPMSSFHRMLIHRAAAWFGMDHNLDVSGNCVIVNRTKNTRIPEKSFTDFIRDDFLYPEEPKRYILKRDSASFEDGHYKSSDDKQLSLESRRSKSFEEREEEYERARRRIFNRDDGSGDSRYRSNDSMRDSSDDIRWQDVAVWSSCEVEPPGRHLRPHDRSRLLKVESFEGRDTLKANSMRMIVSKSNSFGGYTNVIHRGDSTGSRGLSKQDSGSSISSSRLSPSSSGYKSQSQRSDATLSATPSPTATPVSLHHPSSSEDTLSPEPPVVMWPISNLGVIPPGSVLINPATGQPICNADGSVYLYDPEHPLKPQPPPSDVSDQSYFQGDGNRSPVPFNQLSKCDEQYQQSQSGQTHKLQSRQTESNAMPVKPVSHTGQTTQPEIQTQDQVMAKPPPNTQLAKHTQSKNNQASNSQSRPNSSKPAQPLPQNTSQTKPVQSKTTSAQSTLSKSSSQDQSSHAQSNQSKPFNSDVKQDQLKYDQYKMDQLKLGQSKSEHQKLYQSEPNQPKIDQSDNYKTDQQKSDQCKLDQQKPDVGKIDQQKSDKSKSDHSKQDQTKRDYPKSAYQKKQEEDHQHLQVQSQKTQKESSVPSHTMPYMDSASCVAQNETSPVTLQSPLAGQPLVAPPHNAQVAPPSMLPMIGSVPTNGNIYSPCSNNVPYPNGGYVSNYATSPDGYLNGAYAVPYITPSPMNGYPLSVDPATGAILTQAPASHAGQAGSCCPQGYPCPYMQSPTGGHPNYDQRSGQEANGMSMNDLANYMVAMNVNTGQGHNGADQRAAGDVCQAQGPQGPQVPQQPPPQIMTVPGSNQHPGATYYWGPQISSQTQGYPQMMPMFYVPQNMASTPQSSSPSTPTGNYSGNANLNNQNGNSNKDYGQNGNLRDNKDNCLRDFTRDSKSGSNSSTPQSNSSGINSRNNYASKNVAASYAKGAALYQPPSYPMADRNAISGYSGDCMTIAPPQGVHVPVVYTASPIHSSTMPTQAYHPNSPMTSTGSSNGGPVSYYQSGPGDSPGQSQQSQPLIAMTPYGPQQGYNPAAPTPPLTPTPMLGAQGAFSVTHPYLYGNGLAGPYGMFPPGGTPAGPAAPAAPSSPSFSSIAPNQSPLLRAVPRPNLSVVPGNYSSAPPRSSIPKGYPRPYNPSAGRKDHSGLHGLGDQGSVDKSSHIRYPQAIPVSMINLSPRYMSGDVRLMSTPRFPFTIPSNYHHRAMRPMQHSYFPRPHNQSSDALNFRPPRARKT